MKDEWAFGLEEDDDSFRSCATREEALQEGELHARDFEQNYFYIAKSVDVNLPALADVFSGEDIVERLIEGNYDDLPEGHEEKWIANPTKDQLAELKTVVAFAVYYWLSKHNFQPTWYSLGEMERIEFK